MPNQASNKRIQILADFTLSNSKGDIKMKNDSEGNLVVDFPNQKSFFSILNTRLPFRSSWKSVSQANQIFLRCGQPIIVKVDGQPWITLGRFARPKINYRKVAYPYITETPSAKNILYVIGAALGATLLFVLFRKRN